MRAVPEIRFPDFVESWEQQKLSDILDRRIEYRQQSEEYPRLAFAAGQGVIPLNERKTNNREQLTKDEFSKQYLVTELNDIVYNPANVKYGAIDRNKLGKGLISPIYVTFITNENPGFIERILTSHDFQQRALRFEEGTVTKRQSVNPEDLVTLDVFVAPQKLEQQKISEFFDSIDNLITLHQREAEQLRVLKRGLLQKMFPREGQITPEIRFPGFTEPWEQRKLSDLIIEYKETVDSDCTLPVLTSSKTEGVVLQEEHFGRVQNHDITGYNILPRNYCTYRNRSDGVDFTFNINRCCDKGIISKFYPVFYGNNSDIFFISMVLNYCGEVAHEIAYTCTGTGQKVLSFLDLQKMNIRVPSYDEQKKISQYFEQLDNLITLHQCEHDKLSDLKHGLLQKMFV